MYLLTIGNSAEIYYWAVLPKIEDLRNALFVAAPYLVKLSFETENYEFSNGIKEYHLVFLQLNGVITVNGDNGLGLVTFRRVQEPITMENIRMFHSNDNEVPSTATNYWEDNYLSNDWSDSDYLAIDNWDGDNSTSE